MGVATLTTSAATKPADADACFVAYAAHELRGEIAFQLALAEVTLADPNVDTATLRRMGEQVAASCEWQERLLEALLTLARGEYGRLQRERVDLAAITAEVLRAHDHHGLRRTTTLEPARLTGDPRLVERVVANLVANAVRHNIPGGRIDIATHTRAGRATFTIANTGPLVPTNELTRLFQPFQRLNPHAGRSTDGAGLGLAIVRAIANAHDATVTAQARAGGGLRIDIDFPAEAWPKPPRPGLMRSRTYFGRVGRRMCRRLAAAGTRWRRITTTSEPAHGAIGAMGSRDERAPGAAAAMHHIPKAPRTEARWRARLPSIAWTSAAILTVAIGLPACGGSASSKPVAATRARTSTAALLTRTRTAPAIASPATCVNANAQAPAAGAGTPSVALPTTDPFYKWVRSLTHDVPGTILRTRTIAPGDGNANTPLKTTQLLYVTTDELGCRTVSVVTVFQPHRQSAVSPTRLFSYQTSYDALGSQCDPSYTLRAGTEGETGFITSLAHAGDTVLMADYEGEDAAYGVGQLSGYQTLDAIRAAETWLGVPEASTPVGMLGYSGGAVATEFASELAPTYAPHLDIVGVAEGGIPVDLFHELTYINHPNSPWTGQIPSYLDGLARGFDVRDLYRFYTPEGIKVASADQTQCAGTFTGLTTKQMLKPRYQDIEKIPVFVRMFDQSLMGRSGTPRGPLFIANGLSDRIGDGVTVTSDVQQLAYSYCRRGAAVEFHVYKGLNHSEAGTPFFAQGQTFLAQRFKNLPFHDRCADIGPGNSVAAVQVPAS